MEQISAFLSSGGKEWKGTPTELAALLGVDMKPNALTRRLNVNAGRLLNEYGIRYESSRSRSERNRKADGGSSVTICDGVTIFP